MVTWLLWGTAHWQILNWKFLSVSNSKPRFNLVFWLFEPRFFLCFSKLRQSSWHWASTGWRRWPCRRLGSTAALSAGLELGFCKKSNITSTQQIWKFGKKQFAFIFIHFRSFSFPLWHHLWDLYGFVWICGMSNVQILRWVMCGQSSLTTFARMALQEHNLVFKLRSWSDLNTWYRYIQQQLAHALAAHGLTRLGCEDPVADANDWMICLQCDCRTGLTTGFFEKTRLDLSVYF